MNRKIKQLLKLGLIIIVLSSLLNSRQQGAADAKITVQVNKPGHIISPTLFGIFFEDINLSADGGIYPELVRNRSFEDADTLQNWKFVSPDNKSTVSISTADVQARPPLPPLNPFNRKSLCIKANGPFKLESNGYWGMNIVQDNGYSFRLAARSTQGFDFPLKVRIVGTDGKELSSGEIKGFENIWKYFTLNFKAAGSDPKAHLEISGEGNGTLYLDMVSILPDQTWKNHGLRMDLSEALDALHPKFLRFPGGCWVEGDDFVHMNHWKNTIGSTRCSNTIVEYLGVQCHPWSWVS